MLPYRDANTIDLSFCNIPDKLLSLVEAWFLPVQSELVRRVQRIKLAAELSKKEHRAHGLHFG
jgi:hypothetical protein